ncbi:MAG: RND transporter [Rhodobacteraceae bacterium PARR1]|jgi:membrane fusion protein, heavy metal efflux system|nr:MAG: RND transporter [Rhodobacteraceae bacterium PARR1]
MRFVGALAVVLMFAFTSGVAAHEGHDHGAPPPPVSTTIAPRVEASSLVFEAVVIARGAELQVYVDTFDTNAPVAGAAVEMDTPSGVITGTETAPGVYAFSAPWVATPGSYDLAITVIADAGFDVLVGSLTIPAPPPAAVVEVNAAAAIGASVLGDLRARLETRDLTLAAAAAIGLLVGVFGMLLLRRNRRPVAHAKIAALLVALLLIPPSQGQAEVGAASAANAALPMPAAATRDVAQRFPDGAIFVPKGTQRVLGIRTLVTETAMHGRRIELPGRIIPDPNASGYVQASLEGRLVAPPGGFPQLGSLVKAGQIVAIVEPTIGAVDLADRQQQIREIEQELQLVTRRLDRRKQLESVVAQTEIEELEIEQESLIAQRDALVSLTDVSENLIAPVDGVIAAGQAIAGQIASPGVTVYEIVDPGRFWVEALSYRSEALGLEAVAVFADGSTIDLAYQGTGLADQGQAVPVRFSVVGDAAGLRAGQLLRVIATTPAEHEGIVVPRDAVLRGANGQLVVYVKTNAERFVQREVRVEPLDGDTVLVVAGLEVGLRVVAEGAELLNQIR